MTQTTQLFGSHIKNVGAEIQILISGTSQLPDPGQSTSPQPVSQNSDHNNTESHRAFMIIKYDVCKMLNIGKHSRNY